MDVLRRVAGEKKVSPALEVHSESQLTFPKASCFSVVERIPEMNEIKLGGVNFHDLIGLDCIDLGPQDSLDPTNSKTPRWP